VQVETGWRSSRISTPTPCGGELSHIQVDVVQVHPWVVCEHCSTLGMVVQECPVRPLQLATKFWKSVA